jgi:hypothetical protein
MKRANPITTLFLDVGGVLASFGLHHDEGVRHEIS